jgi:hypothetical protein
MGEGEELFKIIPKIGPSPIGEGSREGQILPFCQLFFSGKLFAELC